MPKTAKKPSATRKRLTSERAMKLRPADAEPEKKEEKKPRQARLPEMEDAAIEELESAAERYASIRDRRQALTSEEVRLKNDLLGLMHSHQKTEYNHGGVSIKVVVESEKVRVRIKKETDQ